MANPLVTSRQRISAHLHFQKFYGIIYIENKERGITYVYTETILRESDSSSVW